MLDPGQMLLLPSLGAALLFLLSRHRAPYPGSPVIKALGCALLAVAAIPTAPLLAVALALSALGDCFLALRGERHFLNGLIAFLVAHIVYAAIFAQAWAPSMASLWGAAAVVLAGIILAVWLYPGLGKMRRPVLAYTSVIVTMAVMALQADYQTGLLVPGALLFMFSDSCIAVRRFKSDFAFSGELTWATYYGGQLLLFLAVMGG